MQKGKIAPGKTRRLGMFCWYQHVLPALRTIYRAVSSGVDAVAGAGVDAVAGDGAGSAAAVGAGAAGAGSFSGGFGISLIGSGFRKTAGATPSPYGLM